MVIRQWLSIRTPKVGLDRKLIGKGLDCNGLHFLKNFQATLNLKFGRTPMNHSVLWLNRTVTTTACMAPWSVKTIKFQTSVQVKHIRKANWELKEPAHIAKTESSDKAASDTERHVITWIVGRLEVDNTHLGHLLSQPSRLVVFIPPEFNPDYGFLKWKDHIPDDLSSENVFHHTWLFKYMDRHEDLTDVFYPDWGHQWHHEK